MKIERPVSKQPIPEHAKKVFHGVLFDVYQWEQELFDGTTTTFEKLKRQDVAIMYGVTEEGTILMTQEQQPGRIPFIGAPGGHMEEGEEPYESAIREFREETGYMPGHVEYWSGEQPSAKIDWAFYVFVATGCKHVGDIQLDGGEKIELLHLSFDEFFEGALNKTFGSTDLHTKILEAKMFPEKMQELKRLFGQV